MNKAYRHVYKDGIGWVAIAENGSCVSSSKGSGTVSAKTKVEVLKNFFDLRNSVVLNNGFLLKGLFAATLFCGVVVQNINAEEISTRSGSTDIQNKASVSGGSVVYTDDVGRRIVKNKQGGYMDPDGKGYIKINNKWYKVNSYDEKGVITLDNGKKYVVPTGTFNAFEKDPNYNLNKLYQGSYLSITSASSFFEVDKTYGNGQNIVEYNENDKKWYVYDKNGNRLYLVKTKDGKYGLHKEGETKGLGDNGYYIYVGSGVPANLEGMLSKEEADKMIKGFEELSEEPDFEKYPPTRLSLVGKDGASTKPQQYTADDKEVKENKKKVGDNKNGTIRLGNIAKAKLDDEAVNLGQLNEKLQNVKAKKVPYVSIKSSITSDGSNYNSDGATGKDSIAIGPSTTATDTNATAIGHNASAQRKNAIAIGTNAQAKSQNVVSIGESAGNTEHKNGNGSIFIGRNAGKNSNIIDSQSEQNWGSVYIGQDAGTGSTGDGNLYLGSDAGFKHDGSQNIFLGDGARNLKDKQKYDDKDLRTKGNRNIAIGNQYVHNPDNVYKKKNNDEVVINDAITIGTGTRVGANRAIAIGSAYSYKNEGKDYIATVADGENSIALGSGIFVNSQNGVAIGFESGIGYNRLSEKKTEPVADAVALGSYSQADRKALDDYSKEGVYLSGNEAVAETIKRTKGAISVGSNQMGHRFTRQITNVAAGTTDTDAVNIAQLKAGLSGKANLDGTNLFEDIAANKLNPNFKKDNWRKALDISDANIQKLAQESVVVANGENTTVDTDTSTAGKTTYKVNVKLDEYAKSADIDTKLGDYVKYDSSTKEKITLGGSGATKQVAIKNLASAGDITKDENKYNAINAGDLKNALSGVNKSITKISSGDFKSLSVSANGETPDDIKANENIDFTGTDGIKVAYEASVNKFTFKADISSIADSNVFSNKYAMLNGSNLDANKGFSQSAWRTALGLTNDSIANIFEGGKDISITKNNNNNKYTIAYTGGGTGTGGISETEVKEIIKEYIGGDITITNPTNPNDKLITHNVSEQKTTNNQSIIAAINKINEQGIGFVHVNGGKIEPDTNGISKNDSQANGDDSIAIGPRSQANRKNTIALGADSIVNGDNSGAMGYKNKIHAGADGSFAIGNNVVIEKDAKSSLALGENTKVSVASGVALGSGSVANRTTNPDGYIPAGATADQEKAIKETSKGSLGVVSVGEFDGTTLKASRQITGVAAGTQDSDAVNVAQLKAVQRVSQSAQWIAADNRKFDKNGEIVDNNIQAEAKGVNSVAIGAGSNTKVVSNGRVIERPNTVSVGGLNKDGTVTQRTISNVAPGVLDSDAATMGQLRAGLNDVYGKLGEYKKEASAGTASALAVGNLPQATIPGKGMVSLGSGFYDGESAMAIGLSKMSDSGKWVFKGSASYDSQEKAGAALSVGFHF